MKLRRFVCAFRRVGDDSLVAKWEIPPSMALEYLRTVVAPDDDDPKLFADYQIVDRSLLDILGINADPELEYFLHTNSYD